MSAQLSQFIVANKHTIVDRFVAVVRDRYAPAGATRGVIVDHIPQFLDALVAALVSDPEVGPRTTLATMRQPARDHGVQRLAHGFELEGVVREYGALRHVILDLAEAENLSISPRTYDVFSQGLASGVLSAVVQYTEDRQRDLVLERQRLRTSLAMLPVGVFINDADGAIVEINDAARAIWGEGPPIEGTRPSPRRGWFPASGRVVAPHEWPAARSLANGEVVYDCELEIETVDTRCSKTILVSSAPVLDEHGARIGAVSVHVDVTSRARRMTETTEALRARDEVMSIVSHDLRNPLGAIRLSAQRLLRGAQNTTTALEPSEVVPVMHNITRSCERMERLIADLLDVARIEAGRFSIMPATFSLVPAVREAVELMRPLAEAKHIVVHVDGDDSADAVVQADRDRILQVVSNLLGNAIKFTPDGGVVTVRAERAAEEVHVSVADTRPGVPESVQPKIWDRFFTTQGERRLGTGLGLAIVKGIVEEHGGRVWVESTQGLGATFHFTLPRLSRKATTLPA